MDWAEHRKTSTTNSNHNTERGKEHHTQENTMLGEKNIYFKEQSLFLPHSVQDLNRNMKKNEKKAQETNVKSQTAENNLSPTVSLEQFLVCLINWKYEEKRHTESLLMGQRKGSR